MSETAPFHEPPLYVEDEGALEALLRSYGFDTTQWGEGATKTVSALWEEIAEGETDMIEVDGELIRRTYVAAVDVAATLSDGSHYKLREDRQVFANGSVRRRNLMTSLAEKIKPQEETKFAVVRALQEELGIEKPAKVTLAGTQLLDKNSQTFGGIRTQLELSFAAVVIDEADFDPDGYVERQPDKTIYFKWDEVE